MDKKSLLIAGCDLDIHQVVSDILEITFKGIEVDRALDREKFIERLNDVTVYSLIVVDVSIDGSEGESIIDLLEREYARYLDRVVFILESRTEADGNTGYSGYPHVVKPFSLDEFDTVVRENIR
jgi:DNA-binding response OmpR family regulator